MKSTIEKRDGVKDERKRYLASLLETVKSLYRVGPDENPKQKPEPEQEAKPKPKKPTLKKKRGTKLGAQMISMTTIH